MPETAEKQAIGARLTPVAAIKTYCLEICPRTADGVGNHGRTHHSPGYVVASCDLDACSLHPYRLGKNPARAHIGGAPTHRTQGG